MGAFRITVEVGDLRGTRFEPREAVVDTGASHTILPASVLRGLGVEPVETWPFRLADNRERTFEVGEAQIRIDGRTRVTVVVFGDEGVQPLLGAVTLEEFGLGVDLVGRRLIPVPDLLL